MRNLAGNKECDEVIEQELKRAGIEIVYGPRSRSEVAATITGKLGSFTFFRAWTYWVVNGLVPLAVAQELYADPVGVTDIRVDGHCGCPPPQKPWVKRIIPDGRHVVDAENREKFKDYFDASVRGQLAKEFVFSDDPAAEEANEYVDCYHIDSEAGLRVFADTIRKHGLDKPTA